jgi:hypothetical protein
MRAVFPKWGWLKRTRNLTYLDEPKANQLLHLGTRRVKQIAETPVKVYFAGAGFGGTPEQNSVVEKAACKAVRAHFEKKGYEIISREKEKIGCDFDASRKGEGLHIEVKGISGSILRFPMTANEIDCARSDMKFCLAVVTEAKSPQKEVRVISRQNFLKHFHIKPLAFFAEAKSSLFA